MFPTISGYLSALRKRRAFFKANGATTTDHGHLTALTADLSALEASALYERIYTGKTAGRRCGGTVPGADADGDGRHERGRWG